MRPFQFTYFATTPEDTLRLGEIIGQRVKAGDVILLCGDLGAGKTWLTKGIAKGLEVPFSYPITSPTFTFVHEYPGRIPLYHIDLYRLEGDIDWDSLGLEEYLYGSGVTVIEWAEKLCEAFVPERFLKAEILFYKKGRKIKISTNIEHLKRIGYDLNSKLK